MERFINERYHPRNGVKMKKNERDALLALMGGIGFIFLFAGIFLPQIDFIYGLFAALAFWILTGVLKAYFGAEEE